MSKSISSEELACAAWPVAVGETIARHSSAIALVRDKLVVEVEDGAWQRPLFQLQAQILQRLSEVVGQGLVGDLEVRIARQRRPPQRAMQNSGQLPGPSPAQPSRKLPASAGGDEADQIKDPGMRIVYKQARKRATA